MPLAEVCRKAGISQANFFNWKKKYAWMLLSEMKGLLREHTFVCATYLKFGQHMLEGSFEMPGSFFSRQYASLCWL
jgi:hypothetical protein